MTATANWIWVHRLDLPEGDDLRDQVYYMDQAEVTKVVDDWNTYVSAGTPTGAVYEYHSAAAPTFEFWLALDFESVTYIETSKT